LKPEKNVIRLIHNAAERELRLALVAVVIYAVYKEDLDSEEILDLIEMTLRPDLDFEKKE